MRQDLVTARKCSVSVQLEDWEATAREPFDYSVHRRGAPPRRPRPAAAVGGPGRAPPHACCPLRHHSRRLTLTKRARLPPSTHRENLNLEKTKPHKQECSTTCLSNKHSLPSTHYQRSARKFKINQKLKSSFLT